MADGKKEGERVAEGGREKLEVRYIAAGDTVMRFHASDKWVRALRGPVGSSKSSACIWELFRWARFYQDAWKGVRDTRFAVIRKTYGRLVDTTLKTFIEWIPEVTTSDGSYSFTLKGQAPIRGELRMSLPDRTKVKSEFIFLALDTEEDVGKLQSLDLTAAWVNEAVEIDKAILDILASRVDRYPPKKRGGATRSGIIMDTNPPDSEHWWYRLAELERPDGWEFFCQPPAILPSNSKEKDGGKRLYLPNTGQDPRYGPAENAENHKSGFNYWLRQTAGKNEEWIKVFLMGQYGIVSYGKPVYHEYNDQIHTSKTELTPYRGLPLNIGVDFGRTPTALIGQYSPRGQLRILDELVSENMGIREFLRDFLKPHLVNHYGGMRYNFVVDPAGGQKGQIDEVTCIQEMAHQGFRAIPAKTNLHRPRREAAASFMLKLADGEPGLLISPKCKVLRKALMSDYHYRSVRVSGKEQYGEVPEKNHPASDVCFVGDTQVLMEDGTNKAISDVRRDDVVETHLGPRRVSSSGMTKRLGVVTRIEFNNGTTLEGTGDHAVGTPFGWKRLGELICGDVLLATFNAVVTGVHSLPQLMPVYNIEVEEAHTFYANGILVHNCDCLEYLAMDAEGGRVDSEISCVSYAARKVVRSGKVRGYT